MKPQIRIHTSASPATLIYLPGLHGDWTLIGGFRHALAARVRFVEVTYPRTLDWSLADYAAGIERALADRGVTGGWLLGESFGSQVVWPMLARRQFRAEGVILAGGFVRHPMRRAVRLAERMCGNMPLGLVARLLFGYARVARFRFRHDPHIRSALDEFIAARSLELDRKAAQHRLHLVAGNDPCLCAGENRVPVYALSGLLDPVVPWIPVRRWLRRHCPALREYRILPADHNVLSTAPDKAADLVVHWMQGSGCGNSGQASRDGPAMKQATQVRPLTDKLEA